MSLKTWDTDLYGWNILNRLGDNFRANILFLVPENLLAKTFYSSILLSTWPFLLLVLFCLYGPRFLAATSSCFEP